MSCENLLDKLCVIFNQEGGFVELAISQKGQPEEMSSPRLLLLRRCSCKHITMLRARLIIDPGRKLANEQRRDRLQGACLVHFFRSSNVPSASTLEKN